MQFIHAHFYAVLLPVILLLGLLFGLGLQSRRPLVVRLFIILFPIVLLGAGGDFLGVPFATNNTMLQAMATTQPFGVWRLGVNNLGDAPPILYQPSNVACSLNAGNGDGWTQVKSSDNKCWLAVLVGIQYVVPTTGITVNITSAFGDSRLVLDPAGTLAALTVTMPVGPTDRQVEEVMSSQQITALTPAAPGGATINGGVFMMPANSGASWQYRAANAKWYRRY